MNAENHNDVTGTPLEVAVAIIVIITQPIERYIQCKQDDDDNDEHFRAIPRLDPRHVYVQRASTYKILYKNIFSYACVFMCSYLYFVYVYVYMCTYIPVYMCIFIYVHLE